MRLFRPLLIIAAILGIALSPARAGASTASTAAPWWVDSNEASIIDWLNSERGWYGRPPLVVDPNLTTMARQQAWAMASCGCLYHQSLQPALNQGWNPAGENVGYAGDLWSVHVALSYSPLHLQNILGWGYKGMGIGVAVSNGRVYVSQVFGGF